MNKLFTRPASYFLVLYTLLLTPGSMHAQEQTGIGRIISGITDVILNGVVVFAFATVMAAFVYNIYRMMSESQDTAKRGELKQRIVWNVILMIGILGVWGIISLLGGWLGVDTGVTDLEFGTFSS